MTLHLPRYDAAHILVVGDVMLDRYWHGTTSRISPEAPVPVVRIDEMQELPGAAANVALNIKALGGHVTLLSMSGDDALADTLTTLLNAQHIETYLQRVPGMPTISKLRVLSLHQQLIRLDFEKEFRQIDPAPLFAAFENALKTANIVVLSDYAKGVIQHAPTFIAMAKKSNVPVFVDPKGEDFSLYQGATLLTPNRKEFETIVGRCENDRDFEQKGLALIKQLHLSALLITRSEEGMTLICQGGPALHMPAKKREVYDVTGAGDTVIGVLAASVAAGCPLEQAVVLANLAAGVVVSKLGAATVSVPELRRALQEEHNMRRGVFTEEQAWLAICDAHAHGERVVMTNGCFDILHPGHVAYLEEAKRLGDYLLVAVNDDNSVKRLKGNKRPINPLAHRMAVVAGLASVDWVVPFSEDTPERLIGHLLPDVLVKGGDYTVDTVVGAKHILANGGEVKILKFLPGYSTSAIIEKMESSL